MVAQFWPEIGWILYSKSTDTVLVRIAQSDLDHRNPHIKNESGTELVYLQERSVMEPNASIHLAVSEDHSPDLVDRILH